MAITRQQKEEILQKYAEKQRRAQVMIWANYRGLKVSQIQDLRRQMRAVGAEAVVVKNTLMRKTLEHANLPTDPKTMTGPCVVTFIYGEIAPAIKVVTDYARLNEAVFQVTGGVVGNKLVNAEQVRALTTMPSREVMLAKAIGTMQAPITGFVGTLAAVMRGVLNVLNARSKQLEGSAS